LPTTEAARIGSVGASAAAMTIQWRKFRFGNSKYIKAAEISQPINMLKRLAKITTRFSNRPGTKRADKQTLGQAR
jgi:hypothetical protein